MEDLTKVKEYVRKRINGNIIRKDLLIEKVYNKFGFDAAVYTEKYIGGDIEMEELIDYYKYD
tara:strand:- start:440 stop:625 length:186 start_codon:yes stop_codon:yes gene_type:complete